jgi:hypothetical protein
LNRCPGDLELDYPGDLYIDVELPCKFRWIGLGYPVNLEVGGYVKRSVLTGGQKQKNSLFEVSKSEL